MPRNYLVFALLVLTVFSGAQYYGYSPVGAQSAGPALSGPGRTGGSGGYAGSGRGFSHK